MTFIKNAIQRSLLGSNIKLWMVLLMVQLLIQPKKCLDTLSNETDEKEKYKGISFFYTNNGDLYNNESIAASEQNFVDNNTRLCEYYNSSSRLICKGLIDYDYLKTIQKEQITDFIVQKYEAERVFKRKYWSINNLKTGEWYAKLPKLYQTLKGDVILKDTGLQISVILRLLPRKEANGFFLEGEAYSNKGIKISWNLSGKLFLAFVQNQTRISMNVDSGGGVNGWSLQTNLTFSKRNPGNDVDEWKVFGLIKSHYVSQNMFVIYKGLVWTRMTKGECIFSGEVKVQNVDLEATIIGSVASPQNKQITIPSSAFSKMKIKNIIFKDSIFCKDFDKNAFKDLNEVETITFLGSKFEEMPRISELLQNLSNLKEIFIEDCITPQLKFGTAAVLEKVQALSFKGSGPLTIDDLSFAWLKKSNLTALNMENTHIKISVKGNSILWSVSDTLQYLDISYSSLTEKDLTLLLKDLSITNFKADGLKFRKVPTNGLSYVWKTLQFLSLRGNNFKKTLEKHMFESIFNFPLMPELSELNLMECHINYLEKGMFNNLPNLKMLYLSYNNLENLQDAWTYVKPKVLYLDISHNGWTPQMPLSVVNDVGNTLNLSLLENLETLDLSDGIFTNPNKLIASLSSSLKNLSLKNTGLEDLSEDIFQNLDQLESLDMSFNRNIKIIQPFSFSLFKYLKNLKSLSLKQCRINSASIHSDNTAQSFDSDNNYTLKNVEYLDLSANNIKLIGFETLKLFPKLKILNLSGNSVTVWKTSLFTFSEDLETVFLDENKIETISADMLSDIKKLKNITLGNNPFFCGSYVYEILKIVGNDLQRQKEILSGVVLEKRRIFGRKLYTFMKKYLQDFKERRSFHSMSSNKVNFLDWSDNDYVCFSWSQGKFIPFIFLNETFGGLPEKKIEIQEVSTLWLSILVVSGVVISVGIVCWKCLDVHLITRAVRNAVALSFLERAEKEPVQYDYNIFVSYSDKDRKWVIENLIPRLESYGDLRVCLHERDFQVGLGILENIIASIDSSKNIILVLSQAFLKSQWCQYEMHLAQHRLLEKGRDQLLLIFLENIPPIKRPKTLKYLMMTKTYLEWPVSPKSSKDVEVFWNRLMKSLQGVFN